MMLTILHKRIKFAENMSIHIWASKFMVVMDIGVHHTQFYVV